MSEKSYIGSLKTVKFETFATGDSIIQQYNQARSASPFQKLSDTVTTIFRDEIIRMNLHPGDRINISEVSKALDVSRTPVAAAMDNLVNEGLLEKTEGTMFRVAPMNIASLLQLCDARQVIEGGAAYLASKHISVAELEILKEHCNRYSSAVSAKDIDKRFEHAKIDDSFHFVIIKASKNIHLIQSYLLIRNQLLRYRYYIDTIENRSVVDDALFVSANTHIAIFNALKLRLSLTAKEEAERDSQNMHMIFSALT